MNQDINQIQECLGRITRPFNYCAFCKKDELNLRCPGYTPHTQIELIEVDDLGLEGFVEDLKPVENHKIHWLHTKLGQAYLEQYGRTN